MRRAVVTAAVVLAVLAAGVLVWSALPSAPEGPTPSAGEQPSDVGVPGAPRTPVPPRGRARPPDVTTDGRRVWIAPPVRAEARLRSVAAGLPGKIDLAQSYPVLRAGDIGAARMTMAITDDTASIRQLLVLGETGQVFEVSSLAWGQQTVTTATLSERGTRVRLGVPDGSLVLDLLRLRADRSSREPPPTPTLTPRTPGLRVRFWSGPGKRSPFAPRVARAATGLRTGFDTRLAGGGDSQAVLVDGAHPAALVLDGRASYCCAVAGWLAPDQVLIESRSVDQLRLLAWDTRSGRVDLASTIAPVVGNDWYLATSYPRLASGAR